MLTITQIRQQYPNPGRQPLSPRDNSGAYCVGMAVLLAAGLWTLEDGFPGERDLADGFETLNPTLVDQPPHVRLDAVDEEDQTRAYELAGELTRLNDAGDFEAAWEVAGLALTVPSRGQEA